MQRRRNAVEFNRPPPVKLTLTFTRDRRDLNNRDYINSVMETTFGEKFRKEILGITEKLLKWQMSSHSGYECDSLHRNELCLAFSAIFKQKMQTRKNNAIKCRKKNTKCKKCKTRQIIESINITKNSVLYS